MTITVRRRPGRPKGSRNKPKPLSEKALEQAVSTFAGPVELEQVWEDPAKIRPAIQVILHMRVALSTPGTELAVTWPTGWPLPAPGDRVVVQDMGGVVQFVEYHPARGFISIVLR